MPPRFESSTDEILRISCPECAGVLALRVEGPKALLIFVCRIGHTFSVVDLLAGKEEQLEMRLWSSLNTLEELIDLMGQLARLADLQGLPSAAEALRARGARGAHHRDELARLIEENRAVEVGDDVTRIHAGSPR